jgi:hypothetical protein
MTTPDDLVERVAWAIASECCCAMGCRGAIDHMVEANIAIAIALEEAARLAEIYEYDELEDDGGATIKPSAAIRAMIKG